LPQRGVRPARLRGPRIDWRPFRPTRRRSPAGRSRSARLPRPDRPRRGCRAPAPRPRRSKTRRRDCHDLAQVLARDRPPCLGF